MIRIIILLLFLPLFSISQNWQWAEKEKGTFGNSVCTDETGCCYVAIDSFPFAKILKYNSLGIPIWKINIWTGWGRSIASDNAGYVYVAGDSSSNMLLAKYDTAGNRIWKINAGPGKCYGVNYDDTGFIYLTGSTTYLQKFDTTGTQSWFYNVNVTGNSVCSDNLGNCYITGKFSGAATFGSTTITALGSQDIFIAKHDFSGNCVWVKRAGGNFIGSYSNDCGYAITTDFNGNIYYTGSMVDTADFDTFTFLANYNDIFLAKCDTNGNTIWVKQATGGSDEEGRCITINNSGNILIGGSYVPTVTFSGFPLTGWGNYDAFLASYDNNGNFLNVIKAGGSFWNDIVYGISSDILGNTFAIGNFSTSAIFGSDTLTNSGAGYNIFIGKVDLSTSLNEIENSLFNINVYPNPSNGYFTIDIDKNINARKIQLIDLLGNITYSIEVDNQIQFNISDISSGTYILTVFDSNNNTSSRKIIVLH